MSVPLFDPQLRVIVSCATHLVGLARPPTKTTAAAASQVTIQR